MIDLIWNGHLFSSEENYNSDVKLMYPTDYYS